MSSQLSANYFQYNQSEDYIQQLASNSPSYSSFPTCEDDGLALTSPDFCNTAKSSPYLVNLFTTHDMESYLAHVSFTDDIFGLPMQLQKLLSEAKEEVILAQSSPGHPPEHRALDHLNMVRDRVLHVCCGDVSVMAENINKVVSDDLLEQLCGI
ncbi:hypothetical protein BGW37DRAFT_492810 [Umbelopsis sp. PMI_123]|jgi:hypothetical protein|nr:hypothetical protein BGW37DRAFT_492810 [Umbelopsis sp. PMI_123]